MAALARTATSGFVLRRVLAILVPALALVSLVVVGLYYHDMSLELQIAKQSGKHVVDLQAEIITREFASVASDLNFLANQGMLGDYLSRGPISKDTLEKEYALFSEKRAVYDQIRYLDATGQEVVRVNFVAGKPDIVPESELQSKADRYYFARTMTLARGEIFVSPFDLNVEQNEIERPLKPVVRFATPVFDKHGVKQGILVLNYLGASLISKLAEAAETFDGSTLLLNRAGYFLRGPTPDDEWGFMLGHHRIFGAFHPEEWERVRSAESGQLQSGRGLFSWRSVAAHDVRNLPDRPEFSQTWPLSDLPDPDAGDSGLIVVSRIPPEAIHRQSSLLLRRLVAFSAVLLTIVAALAWYLAHAGAVRQAQESQLADSERRLRKLSSQLMTAQEEERRSVSRDLHDDLGQVATAIALDLQRAAQTPDVGRKDDLVRHALTGAERLLASIHEISGRIRPTILDDLGLKDAIQNLLGEFERNTGITPRSLLEFKAAEPAARVAENVYRILQECLTNVAKHSQVREVEVMLRVGADSVELTVRDQGRGFATEAAASAAGSGFGLLGMRERTELLGGTLVIKSAPGTGTEVHAVIPAREQP